MIASVFDAAIDPLNGHQKGKHSSSCIPSSWECLKAISLQTNPIFVVKIPNLVKYIGAHGAVERFPNALPQLKGLSMVEPTCGQPNLFIGPKILERLGSSHGVLLACKAIILMMLLSIK